MSHLEIIERQERIIRELADLNEQLCALLLLHQADMEPDLISKSAALRQSAEEFS